MTGDNVFRLTEDFSSVGQIRMMTTNLSEDRLLLYFKHGLFRIYKLEEFNDAVPLVEFSSPLIVNVITFTDHTIVCSTEHCFQEKSNLFCAATGRHYEKLESDNSFLFMGISNLYLVSVSEKDVSPENGEKFVLTFCKRVENPNFHFQKCRETLAVKKFTDIKLDEKKLFILNDPFLKIYNLGNPKDFSEKNLVPITCLVFDEWGYVNHPSLLENDHCLPVQSNRYWHLVKKTPMERLSLRPAHSISQLESSMKISEMVLGSAVDKKALYDCYLRGDHSRIYFKNCFCEFCLVDSVYAPRWYAFLFKELKRGVGYFYSYESRVTLTRFDKF